MSNNEVYQSHKQVCRIPMNRADYNIYRGWVLPADENGADAGYLVEYLDGGEPNDSRHLGYISWSPKKQFDDGYTLVEAGGKTLHNSDISGARKNVKDIKVFGNGDTFQLISKASSAKEGWMKSTKAMQIDGIGCVIQVTTQQWDKVAEALTFVPGASICENDDGTKYIGSW